MHHQLDMPAMVMLMEILPFDGRFWRRILIRAAYVYYGDFEKLHGLADGSSARQLWSYLRCPQM